MINEITCTSNNAIQLSRGELICWVNSVTKANITKIQQLGTGVVYCQLLDIVYPGKVPLGKVNVKAKLEYEYVNNFKILQQCFTKLNILKYIEIQRLVKCRYQDNLQFLQWFKKIFDSTGISKDGESVREQRQRKLSRDKVSINLNSSSIQGDSINQELYEISIGQNVPPQHQTLRVQTQRTSIASSVNSRGANSQQGFCPPKPLARNILKDSGLMNNTNLPIMESICKASFDDEKQFYLRKFAQIEHMMEEWDCNKSSSELIENIRSIILVAPETKWDIVNGEFKAEEKTERQQGKQDQVPNQEKEQIINQ